MAAGLELGQEGVEWFGYEHCAGDPAIGLHRPDGVEDGSGAVDPDADVLGPVSVGLAAENVGHMRPGREVTASAAEALTDVVLVGGYADDLLAADADRG